MIARILDTLLNLLKWPVALVALFSLPALMQAVHYFQFTQPKFYAFLGGIIGYILIKILSSARSNVSMQILAHEFTHIFFALLTFHKVVHIHLNMDESGGAMGFKGKGNWLIVIAPYFFPLFLFFLMMFATFFSAKVPNSLWVNGVFGYFFAYHVESIMVQIHGQQPDFREVGFPFCWCFLPAANLFVWSVIVAFNNGGWLLAQRYAWFIYRLDLRNLAYILQFFTN